MSDTPTAISMWILPSQRNSSKFMKSAKFYLSLKFNFCWFSELELDIIKLTDDSWNFERLFTMLSNIFISFNSSYLD